MGDFDHLLPELEIFTMIQTTFGKLGIQDYKIQYNYRQNLEYYIDQAGINPTQFASVCSAIDKLDKSTPGEVRVELSEKRLQ